MLPGFKRSRTAREVLPNQALERTGGVWRLKLDRGIPSAGRSTLGR